MSGTMFDIFINISMGMLGVLFGVMIGDIWGIKVSLTNVAHLFQ